MTSHLSLNPSLAHIAVSYYWPNFYTSFKCDFAGKARKIAFETYKIEMSHVAYYFILLLTKLAERDHSLNTFEGVNSCVFTSRSS
ncbi:MAG: hypothetical protein NVS4B9_20010 [Ktedonobacteraceae bacterium]